LLKMRVRARNFKPPSAFVRHTITYPAPYENLQDTPTDLPTAEPGTPQISYTVASGDLPVILPSLPDNGKYVAYLIAAGKNTSASSQTVYFRMKKNGASITNGSSSVSAGYFYTRMFWFFDVQPGDVLEIYLWASSSEVNWDYEARFIYVTRMGRIDVLHKDFTIDLGRLPVLNQGSPSYSTSSFTLFFNEDIYLSFTYKRSFKFYYPELEFYKFGTITRGDEIDSNDSYQRNSSSYRPYYYRNYAPTEISYRILRDV